MRGAGWGFPRYHAVARASDAAPSDLGGGIEHRVG